MIFGTHDANTLEQFAQVTARAARTALMADGHRGYIMPIGGVAAYKNEVSIPGVGVDIACGNCAIKTDMRVHLGNGPLLLESRQERKQWGDLADAIRDTISFGMGRKNKADDAPVDHSLFNSDSWFALPNIAGSREELKDLARSQIGTVGGGNHYVDVFIDKDDWVWVGVHFGSRGLGFKIANGFWCLANGDQVWGEKPREEEAIVSIETGLGYDYWRAMHLAGEYAYAGREWVARKVVQLLGAKEVEMVHNHHNFAWLEDHPDETGFYDQYVVVRKGATPAFPGQKGFVGGSMGDYSVILQGSTSRQDRTRVNQEEALFSTVHGAGRVMSRTEAAGKIHRRTGRVIKEGRISWDNLNDWLRPQGTILRGGGLDEAPQAYRRLPEVLAAQGNTIEVLTQLRPIIVVMAGANEYDPFKD